MAAQLESMEFAEVVAARRGRRQPIFPPRYTTTTTALTAITGMNRSGCLTSEFNAHEHETGGLR